MLSKTGSATPLNKRAKSALTKATDDAHMLEVHVTFTSDM